MNFGRDKIHPIIVTFIILLFKKKCILSRHGGTLLKSQYLGRQRQEDHELEASPGNVSKTLPKTTYKQVVECSLGLKFKPQYYK
jgi:hypothetical protein